MRVTGQLPYLCAERIWPDDNTSRAQEMVTEFKSEGRAIVSITVREDMVMASAIQG